MKEFKPRLIDIGFFQLIEEYVSSGDLVSKSKFGLSPSSIPQSLKNNFNGVGDVAEFLALEKECLVRFRAAHVQLTMKSLFFHGEYVNTSFSIMPRKVELIYLLKTLAELKKPDTHTSRFLYLGDLDEGAFAYDNRLIFRFSREGRKYYLSTIETSYAQNEVSKNNLYYSSIVRSMEKITFRHQLTEYMESSEDVRNAIAEIDDYFPVVIAN